MHLFTLVVVAGVLGAQMAPPAIYDTSFSERYSVVTLEKPTLPIDTPLEPDVVVTSPIGASTARVVRTDGTKIPYEDAQALVLVASGFGDPIYFKSKGFRTLTVRWVGERFLFISKGIGRIVVIEEIYDLVDRKWLVQQTVSYTLSPRQ